MWVGGVTDSQTRSKPLKTPQNHPENRLFRPEIHLSSSQISQKPLGGWVGKQIWEWSPQKKVFFWIPSLRSLIYKKNIHLISFISLISLPSKEGSVMWDLICGPAKVCPSERWGQTRAILASGLLAPAESQQTNKQTDFSLLKDGPVTFLPLSSYYNGLTNTMFISF